MKLTEKQQGLVERMSREGCLVEYDAYNGTPTIFLIDSENRRIQQVHKSTFNGMVHRGILTMLSGCINLKKYGLSNKFLSGD